MSSFALVNETGRGGHRPRSTREKASLGVLFWICVGWLALNLFGAIFANVLPLPNPLYQNYAAMNAGPVAAPPLGTDDLGRDIFSRIVYGSRVSIEVSLGSMLIGFGIGAPARHARRLPARKVRRHPHRPSCTCFLAFPAIIATIAVLSFWTPRSLFKIIVVIGVASIPLVYRVDPQRHDERRDQGLRASRPRSRARRDRRILMKELLPNIAPIGVSFLLDRHRHRRHARRRAGLPRALGQSADAVVGQHDQREPRRSSRQNPWLAIFPSPAMCLFLLCLNFIGDRLRSHFDVSEVKL